jgi:predicted peroxiredoxin
VAKKLVFIVTHGPDEPEKATVPFTMAVASQALGADVAIGLQGAGAALAEKGAAETVAFPGCTPLKQLLDAFMAQGGKLYTCGPPLDARKIARDKLIEGVRVVHAETFGELYIGADNILVY